MDNFVDAAFAVHQDYKSHGGMAMKFRNGRGCPINGSKKQKLNTDSSTIAKLVATHQFLPKTLWVPSFLAEQGHEVEGNVLHQDNKSATLLEKNRKRSSGKCTHAVNVRCFMITDQIEKGSSEVVCCPTDDMVGDYMTKGLQGLKFGKFQTVIMGF